MGIDTNAFNENKFEVEVVTLSGTDKYEVTEGMTVGQFKDAHGLTGFVVIDEDSERLNDSDLLREDMQLIVSKPKKNGNN